jgi:hypothetical protein
MHTTLWHASSGFDFEKAVRIASGLLTLLIAGIVAYIAWQQYQVNHRQHRLALFKHRIQVFNATMALIATVLQQPQVEYDRLFAFVRETREHEFLFGPEIGEYINDLFKKGAELHARLMVADQTNFEKRTELLEWFAGQSKTAGEKFRKYLDFRKP